MDNRLLDESQASLSDADPAVVRVWRRGELVFHATVDPAEHAALRMLCGGATFAAISDGCSDAPTAAALLARWLEDELVALATPL